MSTVHVVPLDDYLDHEHDDCACLPETEPVVDDDGTVVGWLIKHRSWDGREDSE